MTNKLLHCPFCGASADVATKKATRFPSKLRIACSNSMCGAHFGFWHPDEWNRRTQVQSADALVEALELLRRVEAVASRIPEKLRADVAAFRTAQASKP